MTLQTTMMHHDVPDLDFDTYFSVASNAIPQSAHSQSQSSFIYNGEAYTEPVQRQIAQRDQLNMSFNTSLPTPVHDENTHQTYFMAGNPNSFQVPDWKFKEEQQLQKQQQRIYTQTQTPATTPSEPYNAVTTLNQSPSRSDYFYEATHGSSSDSSAPPNHSSRFPSPLNQVRQVGHMKKDTSVQRSNSFDYPYSSQQQSTYTLANFRVSEPSCVQQTQSNELSGLQTPGSDTIFPGTSHNCTSDSNSQTSPSSEGSSSIDETLYKGVFETIDRWGRNDADKEQNETRHWRHSKRSDSSSSNTSSMIAVTIAAVNAQSIPHSPLKTGQQLKKVAHNAIERRYRNNINDRIHDLKNVVPALYKARIREKKDEKGRQETVDEMEEDESTDSQESGEIVEGVEVAKKLNKATILHKATEYIHYLKYTNEMTRRENQLLEQILTQMPNGSKVLARFHKKKQDFQKNEQQRQIQERKEAMELEKAERQHILRERAAQRAALAELLPKPSRRPYRRRAKKQTTTDISDAMIRGSRSPSPRNKNITTTAPSDDNHKNLENNNDVLTSATRDKIL